MTRLEKYTNKKNVAKIFPVSIVTINFICEDNIAFVIRTAACFGAHSVHVIGAIPEKNELKRLSGSLNELIEIKSYKNPEEFLTYFKKLENAEFVCAELDENSVDVGKFDFDFEKHTFISIGNEVTGTPDVFLRRADAIVHINMPGVGTCLNASQTANVLLYEYVRQDDLRS